MWKDTPLTQLLDLQYPIVQGPFGSGFSTTLLASTVSNLGGLGSFGAHHLGPQDIVKTVKEIKSLTSKPFAINLWVSNSDDSIKDLKKDSYDQISQDYRSYFEDLKIQIPPFIERFGYDFNEQVEALLDSQPPIFSFVFGIPSKDILNACKKRGIKTIGAATTLEEAMAVEAAGVDCVVVSGMEAGGHRPSFMRTAEESLVGLSTLISVVSRKIKIPIIAAGGIATGSQIIAANVLGASGVQIGTGFLACEESGASTIHKEIIFSQEAQHTVLSRYYTGRLARFINNDFLVKSKLHNRPLLPYPAQNYLLSEIKKYSAQKGIKHLTPLYAGQGASLVNHTQAKSFFESLINEADKVSIK